MKNQIHTPIKKLTHFTLRGITIQGLDSEEFEFLQMRYDELDSIQEVYSFVKHTALEAANTIADTGINYNDEKFQQGMRNFCFLNPMLEKITNALNSAIS